MVTLLTPGGDGTRIADRIDAADPAVITELLRLDAPVQSTVRTAIEPPRTRRCRDRSRREHPGRDRCRQSRSRRVRGTRPLPARQNGTGPPLSFGYGAHYCLGGALAALEISIALPKILARQPVLHGGRCGGGTRRPSGGPLVVPMVFGG